MLASKFDKLKQSLRLGDALRFVGKSAPRWTVLNFFLIVIQAPFPTITLLLTQRLIDSLTAAIDISEAAFDLEGPLIYIILTAGVTLLSSFLSTASRIVNEAQSLVVTDYMQTLIHEQSVKVDLEFYENPNYYDALRRAQREAPYRPLHILQGLTDLVRSILSLIGIAALLFSLHWGALILLIAVLPDVIVRIAYSRKLYEWRRNRTVKERRSHYYDYVLTTVSPAKEVRLFELGSVFIKRAKKVREQLRDEKLHFELKRAGFELLAKLISVLLMYAAYGFIVLQTLGGTFTIGSMIMAYQALQQGRSLLSQILSTLAGLYEDNLFLSNLEEFLQFEPAVSETEAPQPFPDPLDSIVFEDVSFHYPGEEVYALRDVNLTIHSGEKIAIIGENGSGKTTLIKLLCRLYDPSEGRITVNGIDLREIELSSLRRAISAIFQDYMHYNMTALENIWFGNTHLAPEERHIKAASERSGAHGVISKLSDGYETVLGKVFEDGAQLSIGEWQKVALARSFLRDAQIIVLDEPTSSLDARSEYQIFESIQANHQTVLLVSHRFSTTRTADRIYVFQDGRIIESGTHPDLMQQDGAYAHLFRIQAQYYMAQ
jgi:ATP-binding cassette subfamily B protein